MKNIALSFLLFLVTTYAFAQGSKVNTAFSSYTHAQNELKAGDIAAAEKSLKEAAENIDVAITNEKTKIKSKTWRYRGNIYSMISGIESMKDEFPNAMDIAIESYREALALDVKGTSKDDIIKSIQVMYNANLQQGVDAYNQEDFAKAAGFFFDNVKLYDVIGMVDTVGIYNGALSADLAGDTLIAVENYLKSAGIGYMPEYCYNKAIILLTDKGDFDKAIRVSKQAREAFPGNKEIILAQLNAYLLANRYDAAETELEKEAEGSADPNMWFALGVVKSNLGKKDKAIAAYKKSLELDTDYFNSTLNLAILYFQQASEMINAANEIPVNEVEKYNQAKEDALEVLRESIPYFEKAHELQPDNRNILLDLKEAYGHLSDTENYNRVKELLENMN